MDIFIEWFAGLAGRIDLIKIWGGRMNWEFIKKIIIIMIKIYIIFMGITGMNEIFGIAWEAKEYGNSAIFKDWKIGWRWLSMAKFANHIKFA